MVNFEQIPLWIMILSMLVLAALFVWLYTSLMRTGAQKLSVLIALPFGSVTLVLLALLKRDSAIHAMLLFDDAMITGLAAGLAVLPKNRRLRREAAGTGTSPAELSYQDGVRAAWVGIPVGCAFLLAQYLLAWHGSL